MTTGIETRSIKTNGFDFLYQGDEGFRSQIDKNFTIAK